MKFPWFRLAAIAAALYLALLAIGFYRQLAPPPGLAGYGSASQFEAQDGQANTRKNYASAKLGSAPPAGQPLGNTQKYEKIASLSQRTTAFEADRARVSEVIAAQQGQVQSERGTGLAGQRVLYLGIGVPADNFDAFVKAAQAVGVTTSINTVKTDKTNEYLQLRAKRVTLEKTRTALEALQSVGGSIDERINVQNRLTELEEKIQELGVSLGDFDAQNELCTVRLTLEEGRAAIRPSYARMAVGAVEWATLAYAGIASGFFFLMAAGWMAVLLVRLARRAVAATGKA